MATSVPLPHRHADVGGGQRGRVVDAIAHHRHHVSVPCAARSPAPPCRRQHLGAHFAGVNAQALARHGLRRAAVVARDHHRAQAARAQRATASRRWAWARRRRRAGPRTRLPASSKRSTTRWRLAPAGCNAAASGPEIDAPAQAGHPALLPIHLGSPRPAAPAGPRPRDFACIAPSAGHAPRCAELRSTARPADVRCRSAGRGHCQQLQSRRDRPAATQRRELRLADRSACRSCRRPRCRRGAPLPAPRVLDQDAVRAATPVPAMMAAGVARPSAHGQAMTSTATARSSAVSASAPERQPASRREQRDHQHHRHEHGRHLVHQPLDRRLGGLRVFHQADDARQHAFAPTARTSSPAGLRR
jgi:hypothetical protein